MDQHEYEWIRQTRAILLDFCSELSPHDFTRSHGFGFQSIRDTLVHIADCYCAWIGSYLLLQTRTPITAKEHLSTMDIDRIKHRFAQVDLYVAEALNRLQQQMDEPIERPIPWRTGGEPISMTPRKLLLHTITHEFHHKGQIMAMARQTGHEPPNTDVLGV
ncbi:DinB family protein [Paenibacillus wenxiniae]|uniref:DinB family protein n=1 Tax=Paenibacillus wenxiniae TaxID=1636843 RepID=A0ABW4RPH4_9BACL